MPDRETAHWPTYEEKNESFGLPPTAGSAQRKKNSKAASKSRWPIIRI